MRLTCPNCEAQYEVPDEVIPVSGRDVQCSNCGDTWFQHHPDHVPDEEEAQEEPAWDTPPDPAPEPEPDPDPEPVHAEDDDAIEGADEAAAPVRRELDPAVKDVLREEADREQAARQQDAGSIETQVEMGLDTRDDEAEKRSREAQSRMARLRGEPEDDAEDLPDPDPGTRRNLLPDIDEINSSLSSDSADAATADAVDDVAADQPAKSGFRRGFSTVLLLVAIGLLIYMFAPQIAAKVPALEAPLRAFVEIVNGLRVWLDQTVGGLMGG